MSTANQAWRRLCAQMAAIIYLRPTTWMPSHTRITTFVSVLLLLHTWGSTNAQQLGRTLSDAEIEALNRHVFADGSGLPEGSGDTIAGTALFAQHCASCHGDQGQGGAALELVGDRTLLASQYPDKGIAVYWPWAPTLFEYVRRSMPPEAPYSLSVDETYAVVAKLLELNGLIDAGQSVNAAVLSAIEMPNREGFYTDTK